MALHWLPVQQRVFQTNNNNIKYYSYDIAQILASSSLNLMNLFVPFYHSTVDCLAVAELVQLQHLTLLSIHQFLRFQTFDTLTDHIPLHAI